MKKEHKATLKGLLKGNKKKYQIVKDKLNDLTDQEIDQILEHLKNIENSNIEKYSVKNQLLIYMQHEKPTILKGFKDWIKEDRKPLKNTGIFIYAPIIKKENDQKVLKGYFLTTVFDISNTVPIGDQK